ncbi:TPA: hypothetical protein J8K72_004563, partial [Citrobacter koseri]|nr:hypothetical protein [Citrobacter koseri]
MQMLLLCITIPIFKPDYDLVDFLVDISMDAAKAVVSGVVIGVLVTGVLAILSVPVVITTLGIIIVGLFFNYGLNYLDDKIELSASLKNKL